MKVYELALTAGLRSPFAPVDELHPDSKPAKIERRQDKGRAEVRAKPTEAKAG